MLKGKHIIVGVTGSIAAYKAALLIRLLIKEGAEVRVIMTPLAKEFISPLTLATLAKCPILTDFFDPTTGSWNSHVDLGLWADAYLIAPATANTVAKMAQGIADNLLLTTYLSARCPVMIAPAMDLDMFAHPVTQRNLSALRELGLAVMEPAAGELASGLDGKGRMEEPEGIVARLSDLLNPQPLSGKKILITAGPTYEKIDPVRFVGNYSSGKMGFALAEACARRGAEVLLITGPVALKTQHPAIRRMDVESAAEMHRLATDAFPDMDGALLCAAVADFTPGKQARQKLKRGKDALMLELLPTQDIAEAIGRMKTGKQFSVGFALETDDGQESALKKMKKKNFDFVVLNSLQDPQAGFGYDTNKITLLYPDGAKTCFELKSKKAVAEDIADELSRLKLDSLADSPTI